MMAMIGWIICAFLPGQASAGALVIGIFTFGEWNIGGAPNTWQGRVAVVIAWVILAWLWWILIRHAPFSFSMKGIS